MMLVASSCQLFQLWTVCVDIIMVSNSEYFSNVVVSHFELLQR
jgi:hypothetical protein